MQFAQEECSLKREAIAKPRGTQTALNPSQGNNVAAVAIVTRLHQNTLSQQRTVTHLDKCHGH